MMIRALIWILIVLLMAPALARPKHVGGGVSGTPSNFLLNDAATAILTNDAGTQRLTP